MSNWFLILFIISKTANCNDFETLSKNKSKMKTRFSSSDLFFFGIWYYLMIAYFALFFILSFCYCSSEEREGVIRIIHIFGAIIIFISTVLAYTGVSKIKSNDSAKRNYYSIEQALNLLEENNNDLINFSQNLTKYNNYYTYTSKILKQIAIEYNYTFSNKQTIYRSLFDTIYFNISASKSIKNALKQIDTSREMILSKIISFTNSYFQIHNSIQELLENIKANCTLSSEQSQYKLKEYSNDINYNIDHSTDTYDDIYFGSGFSYSYVIITSFLFLALIYGFIFFIENKCSCVCFYLFPIVTIFILFFGIISCYNVKRENYLSISSDCYYRQSILDFNDIIQNDLDQIIYDATHCLSKLNIVNYDQILKNCNISDIIELNKIHQNFEDIYLIKENNEYKENLTKMHLEMKQHENTVLHMQYLFENISRFASSVFLKIKNMQNHSESIYNRSKEIIEEYFTENYENGKSKYDCNQVIKALDLCIIAEILLFIGLIIMSISICFGREPMKCCDSYSGGGGGTSSSESKSILFVLIREGN